MASRATRQHGARKTTRKPSGRGTGTRGGAASSRPRRTSPERPPVRSRSVRGPALAWWAAIVSVVVLAWVFYPALRVQYREEKQRARLEAELNDLRERNGRLRAQVDRLKTPEGVEDVARESLGLVKEGEHAYVVTEGTVAPTVAEPDRVLEETDTVWTQLLDVVFGVRD